jgi:hypothetical protein
MTTVDMLLSPEPAVSLPTDRPQGRERELTQEGPPS